MPKIRLNAAFLPTANRPLAAITSQRDGSVAAYMSMFNHGSSSEQGTLASTTAGVTAENADDIRFLYAVDPATGLPTRFGARVLNWTEIVYRDAPIGFWRLNESSGVLADSSLVGTNSPSTGVGAGVTYGAAGVLTGPNADNALEFTAAASAWVDLGPTTSPFRFAGSANHTIELWLRTGAAYTLATSTLASVHDGTDGWRVRLDVSGALRYMRTVGGVDSINNVTTITTPNGSSGAFSLNAATMYHVVATYDGAANQSTLYLNGVKQGVTVHTTAPTLAAVTAPLVLGASAAHTGNGFDGRYDEVVVYNKVLTDDQVWGHYVAGRYNAN